MMIRQLFGLKSEETKPQPTLDASTSEETVANVAPASTLPTAGRLTPPFDIQLIDDELESEESAVIATPTIPVKKEEEAPKNISQTETVQAITPTKEINAPAPQATEPPKEATPIKKKRRKKCAHHRLFSKKKEAESTNATTSTLPTTLSSATKT